MTVTEYIQSAPDDRREGLRKLRDVIVKNLPEGFAETIAYGMIGYVVPHTLYPAGYHCNPKDPLPFMNLGFNKGGISLYHMALYASEPMKTWFVSEYAKSARYALDMGKSCIRFKHSEDIPFELIAELTRRISAAEWIEQYKATIKR